MRPTRTVLVMEDLSGFESAKGSTMIVSPANGVTYPMLSVAARGLARLHAEHWGAYAKSPMVAWQTELNLQPVSKGGKSRRSSDVEAGGGGFDPTYR